jgi:hypothetical protein
MKNLLILAIMLLTFRYSNAQCFYRTSSTSSYGSKTVIGKIEGFFIYSTSSTRRYGSKKVVEKIEGGGRRCAAAAAYLLL